MSYYDLSKPYSISDWNNLIRDVNDKLENPPPSGEDCEPIDPIEEVTDPHIWSVEDVEEVRDKLIETCPDISFSEPLEIWKPEIIDEIETALEEVWCDCCDEEFLHDEDGTEIQLLSYSALVYSSSVCLNRPWIPPIFLAPIIDGMQLGKSGINSRIWKLWREPVENHPAMITRVLIRSGPISCEGQIQYGGTQKIEGSHGDSFTYYGPSEELCQIFLQNTQDYIADWGPLVYTLEISTVNAECADCDE